PAVRADSSARRRAAAEPARPVPQLKVQANPQVEIRALTTLAEMHACVALQSEIWGDGFDGVVPASLLKVATYVGGVVAGAFDGGALRGFVFGITGVEQG